MTKNALPNWEDVTFDYCRLVDFYLRLDPEVVTKEGDRSYGYEIVISEKQSLDKNIVAVSTFTVQSKVSQKTEAEVGAKYLFAFSSRGELGDTDELVKHVVRFSVWPIFTSSFKKIVSEAELPFPALPLTPDHVDLETPASS
jgi:hypothetical protein